MFADNYQEYTFVRTILDSLSQGKLDEVLTNEELSSPHIAEIKEKLISRSKKVLSSMGTPRFSGRLIKGQLNLNRPSLEDLDTFYKSYPEIIIMALKHDLSIQRRYTLKLIPTTIVQAQSAIVNMMPSKVQPIIASIIGMNYDNYVLKRYLSDIESVINTPNVTTYKRFTVLTDYAARRNSSEFLLTFARIALYSKQWIQLKAQAKELSDEPIYANFYNEMLKAESAVKANKMLSPFYKTSFIDFVNNCIGPAATIYIYNHYAEIIDISSTTMSAVKTYTGF